MTAVTFPNRLKLASLPTPLTRLTRFELINSDTRVWVKHDEMTGTEISGNKIRKLEFIFAEAEAHGCRTIITCGGIQSNHCRATAVMAARLGYRAHLILRGEKPTIMEGNLLMDYLAGALIDYLPQEQWSTHTDLGQRLVEAYASRGEKALFVPIGASDEIGLWGYIAACYELREDFRQHNLQPDYIVCATGSGGTQGGLIVGTELFDLPSKVVAFNVCDNATYFDRKIRDDVTRWNQRYKMNVDVGELSVTTVEGYVGPGYGIARPVVFELITELARTEGLFLDPVYTGKAFYGLLSELAKRDDGALAGARDVVFIHTGGLFGVFPQQSNFDLALHETGWVKLLS
ncbi:MAG: D-cysteine desulfhydrase family protein [Gammaproteobacteria bacterium]|nr:D-cysteine desulfhydrase family protein [Gammaproteobacteria bacterium]